MPRYDYVCLDCRSEAERVKGSVLEREELYEVVFETSHAMDPASAELAEARRCPRCQGSRTIKTLAFSNIITYIRGNGYLDRRGCHRDMNMHKLETGDPYAEMRQPGEVEDLKNKLRKAGQHDPKAVTFVRPTASPVATDSADDIPAAVAP